jgi:hypothetical protein
MVIRLSSIIERHGEGRVDDVAVEVRPYVHLDKITFLTKNKTYRNKLPLKRTFF